MKMTNNAQLFISIDGKLFLVTHICDSVNDANKIMADNKTTSFVAEDEQNRYYLAEHNATIDFTKLQLTSPT
jgi:hypothetical protein